MLLDRDLLMALGLDLNLPKHITTWSERLYEGCMAPMINMSRYNYKPINLSDDITPDK